MQENCTRGLSDAVSLWKLKQENWKESKLQHQGYKDMEKYKDAEAGADGSWRLGQEAREHGEGGGRGSSFMYSEPLPHGKSAFPSPHQTGSKGINQATRAKKPGKEASAEERLQQTWREEVLVEQRGHSLKCPQGRNRCQRVLRAPVRLVS